MKLKQLGMVTGLALTLCAVSPVQASEPVAQHNTNAIWFENWGDLTNAQLKIAMPNGQLVTVDSTSGTPVYQLTGASVLDGIYSYELTAATSETAEVVNQLDNGRGDNAKTTAAKPFYLSGSFQVDGGIIVTPEELTETDGD